MKNKILNAIKTKHTALMEEALVNIEVYENAVGIGEHPDLVGAVEEQVEKYVHSQEIVDGVNHILNEQS